MRHTYFSYKEKTIKLLEAYNNPLNKSYLLFIDYNVAKLHRSAGNVLFFSQCFVIGNKGGFMLCHGDWKIALIKTLKS